MIRGMHVGVESVPIHSLHFDFRLKKRVYASWSIQREATARREEHFIQQNRKHNQTEEVKEGAVRLFDVEYLYGKHPLCRTTRRPSKQ